MAKHCNICKCELDLEGVVESKDCGGDCCLCMAKAGDPDCIREVVKANAEDILGMTISAWSIEYSYAREMMLLLDGKTTPFGYFKVAARGLLGIELEEVDD